EPVELDEPDDPEDDTDGGHEPLPVAQDSQPVPVVAPHAGAAPFEIDEVEALPDGVDDEHEGASDFVPVARPGHQGRGHRA
ncbi:MAG: hypothetical protein HOP99_10825, partial [Dermatophilaceae bacterium]|nr:hypothetical protein [Dermatophilaceae bacterium]